MDDSRSGLGLDPNAPKPRLCHLLKRPDFVGYGFNLHAERNKIEFGLDVGQYIGKIDQGSPAHLAGVKEHDRIVEVNGVNIGNENHKQVVERIKTNPTETQLLVVDRQTDNYYKDKNIIIKGTLPTVRYIKTPTIEEEQAAKEQQMMEKIHDDDDDPTYAKVSTPSPPPPPPPVEDVVPPPVKTEEFPPPPAPVDDPSPTHAISNNEKLLQDATPPTPPPQDQDVPSPIQDLSKQYTNGIQDESNLALKESTSTESFSPDGPITPPPNEPITPPPNEPITPPPPYEDFNPSPKNSEVAKKISSNENSSTSKSPAPSTPQSSNYNINNNVRNPTEAKDADPVFSLSVADMRARLSAKRDGKKTDGRDFKAKYDLFQKL